MALQVQERGETAARRPFRMVCFGDSVMWGQGLPRHQTYANHVWRKLEPGGPGAAPGPLMYAHAGAVLGARDALSDRVVGRLERLAGLLFGLRSVPPWIRPGIGNEIASAEPSVVQQVESFDDSPRTVDLVLINGGGNDIGAVWYMRPSTSLHRLKAKIERHCYADMKALLERVAEKFPNACIVVPGYMQSLSSETKSAVLDTYFARQMVLFIVWRRRRALDRVFERNVMFRMETASALQRAVEAANKTDLARRGREHAAEDARIIFAEADAYQPFNAANAGRPWVWGVDLRGMCPEDSLRDFRLGACRRFNRWSPWYWASLGHPNAQGAAELGEAILARLADWAKANPDGRFADIRARLAKVNVPPPLP